MTSGTIFGHRTQPNLLPPRLTGRGAGLTKSLETHGAEPPSFLVLVDLLTLISAFLVSHLSAVPLKATLLSDAIPFQEWVSLVSPSVGGDFRPLDEVMWVLLVAVAVTIGCIQGMGGYRPLVSQSRTRLIMGSALASLASLGTVTLVLFALRSPNWSRLFIFEFTFVSTVGLVSWRMLLRWYRAKRIQSGFYARNLILIGPSTSLGWLATHFAGHTSRTEYDLIGYLRASPVQHPVSYQTGLDSILLPCLGDVTELSAMLVHRPVHEVVAIEDGSSDWLRQVIETCDYFRITLRIVPTALLTGQLRDLQLIYHSDELRLPEIVLRPRHLDSTALFIKRLVDIALSAIALLALAPLFALIALLIKLTTPRLPIFYRWRVVGFKGTPFTGFKFTTMMEDSDARRLELLPRNEMQGPVFKIKNDPRVTPLGRLLRKYSLNELPQLWSVLKGDMSLVGPRPAFPHELERYELWHKRKLCVRPGITCLWQVRGRNKISKFDDWVRMDLEYIDKWSLWLDVKILARTVWVVVAGSGS